MEVSAEFLEEILKNNPQVDRSMVMQVIEDQRDIGLEEGGMVNFKIKLPYATDNFDRAFQNSWAVDETEG